MALPPDLFGHCILIRDFAEPLHVGSAMAITRNSIERQDQAMVSSTAGGVEMSVDETALDVPAEDMQLAHVADATISAPMVANLHSITGLVQVIPTGKTSLWTSKKRVPMAGYLCTQEGGTVPVLHTLPTPCVLTTLSDDGRVLPPTNATAEAWAGGTKFSFPTLKEAHDACMALTETIAHDRTFSSYDDSDVLPEKQSLLQATSRGRGRAWTTGTKKLLVAVMDWKVGDHSRSPYSEQGEDAVRLYKKEIFPRVVKAFSDMSHGQLQLEVTVIPEVVRYSRKRSEYVAAGYPFPGLYDAAEVTVAGRSDLRR